MGVGTKRKEDPSSSNLVSFPTIQNNKDRGC